MQTTKGLSRGFALWFSTVLSFLLCCSFANAAEKSAAQKAAAIKEGSSLFRAGCSPCHGLNARGGGRGPDLTAGRWTHGAGDAEIFRTITQGVPGTEMPANGFEDSETWAIIAYIRSLAPPKVSALMGDPQEGKTMFFGSAGCSECHMVYGTGGVLGPDLSRVGAARSAAYLIDSIRQPDKDLSSGNVDPNNHYGLPLVYDAVTVVTSDGTKITGIAKNEDTYSLQLISTDQKLHLFLKKDLQQESHEHRSLMPPYSEDAIDSKQLRDLVAYLQTLRGDSSSPQTSGSTAPPTETSRKKEAQ